jgi:PAS domain S-box-containing protein
MIDKSGNFLLFNDWCCNLLGYTREEFQKLDVKLISHPQDLEQSSALNKKIIEGEIETYQMEKRYIKKDKSFIWCQVSASAIKDNDNNVINIIGVIKDITERINSKIALEKSEARLIEAQTIAKVGSWETELNYTEANWSKETEEILGINPKNTPNPIEAILAIIHPEDRLKVETVFVNSIKKNTINLFEHRIITPTGIEKIIEQRWKIERDSQGQPLRAIGTCHDITERKQSENELENEKRRLADILLNTGAGTWEWNIQTGVSIINEQWAAIIGYTLDELKNFTIDSLRKYMHPDDIKRTDTIIEKHFNGELDYYEAEFRMKHKNGHWVWIQDRGKINKWDIDGKPLLMSGTHQDITERKLAEQKLIASEAELRQTQIIANLGSFSLDFTTQKWTSCRVLDKIFGIEPTFEKTMETWNLLLHPDWITIVNNYVYIEVIGKKKNFDLEYKIITLDRKEERWVHTMGELTFDSGGNPILLIGSVQDITERKQLEEKLRLTSEKFEELVNSSEGIIWEADALNFNFTYVSEQAKRLLGFEIEEWYEDGFIAKHLHPEDKQNAVDYCIHQINKMEDGDFMFRFIAKNGEILWLRKIVNIVFEEGRPRWLRGVIFDVTQLKETNLLLSESEEKYRGLVENAPYGIIIYVEDKIAFINAEVIKMARANDKNELIGKSVLDFVHPDSMEEIVRRMAEVHRDENASEIVEAKLMTIDNIPLYVELKAIPTVFDHKQAVQLIIQDISIQKQSALDLYKINRVYELISQINNLIIRTHNREELFQEICNIAVNVGKFRMSWIGFLNDDNTIRTAAFAGFENGYFEERAITSFRDVQEKRGPTRIALNEGKSIICNDIENDLIMKPWRDEALARGYLSMMSIPLLVRNKKIGVFNLYSEQKNFFSSEEEITLLEKITLNISFALESILTEEERKQTDQKIRQLSRAVEQSPVTIIITDIDGKIEYVNPKFVETTGYSLDEIIGQNPRILKSGHTSNEEYKELYDTISSGKEWHGEFHNKKKDGTLYWESATISPILNAQGIITHFIDIKEDITERKIAEQELIKAKLQAEESDRLKLVFLANMSHEIRTPMNGILGFTELLKLPHLSGEEQQEYIHIIEKSGKRMLNIINDIINISKIESGQIEIVSSKTNINEQINYIRTFFKPEAKQKKIKIYFSKELPKKRQFIKTDKEKIYAVLTNLVKNAIKFTNKGSIEIGCEIKEKNLEFFVKDTGIGISNAQQGIIFERFRQANESISRTHEGSGLGLAISKAYIDMLGGKIWVESEIEKGSTFYFTIPFTPEEKAEEIVDDNEVSKTETENKIKDLKVLIVEDDAISKLLITIAIKPYSKEIIKVVNGIEAVTACRDNPDIDLVMMDINMPEMGGYEATRLIREFNKDLVIIAQTANGMQSDREAAIAAGCTDYISKPINIKDLGALIQKYFKK